jgi:hypothetical protein
VVPNDRVLAWAIVMRSGLGDGVAVADGDGATEGDGVAVGVG